MIDLNDVDLLARMRNFENHLVERKTVNDHKDWKKTAVAFANSVPVGLPAVLYIGVRNNGEIETPQRNLDDAQKRFNLQMDRVYPRIAYLSRIISENGQQALAVIIPGSELRPHFAGLSYVRRGSETIEASEEQFNFLIAGRNSKTAKILEFKGKQVTVADRSLMLGGPYFKESKWGEAPIVADCNQFYVTLERSNGTRLSFPLDRLEISFDNELSRLRLVLLTQ
jgi:hypothetical protein